MGPSAENCSLWITSQMFLLTRSAHSSALFSTCSLFMSLRLSLKDTAAPPRIRVPETRRHPQVYKWKGNLDSRVSWKIYICVCSCQVTFNRNLYFKNNSISKMCNSFISIPFLFFNCFWKKSYWPAFVVLLFLQFTLSLSIYRGLLIIILLNLFYLK